MEISIQEALSRITTGQDGPTFSLVIVKSSGKEIGRKVRLARCRYGKKAGFTTKPRVGRSRPKDPDARAHVDNGTLPITDVERNRYLSPLISHIIQYNQCKVIH